MGRRKGHEAGLAVAKRARTLVTPHDPANTRRPAGNFSNIKPLAFKSAALALSVTFYVPRSVSEAAITKAKVGVGCNSPSSDGCCSPS